MDTRKCTALGLILGPLSGVVIWFIIGLVLMNGVAPDDPQKFIPELGANSAAIKYLFPLVTLLFLIGVAGIGAIKNSMEGGSGHYVAAFGFFLIILGSAGQIGETAFTIATAEAAHGANMAVASSMFAGAQAIGAVTTALTMLGFALVGVGIFQQKNFSPLVAGLMIIAGIYTLAVCLVDYESPLIAIGFIGVVVSMVCLGVSLLTQKE